MSSSAGAGHLSPNATGGRPRADLSCGKYYSRDHFRIERKRASPFAADTTGCAWRLRVDCRARIFEFVSQSLTAALNVHPSSTSSTSSPAWSCWRCQTVIQLQKALSGSDHKSQKMSKDRLIKASMATTKVFCV